MAQYQQGGAVAPRPVLELIKQPLYDGIAVANAATTSTWFALAVGATDANAVNAANRTFSDTNLRRVGALATPQQFDAYAISLKYAAAIARADHSDYQVRSNLNFTVGQKSYLRIRFDCLPSDVTQVVDALAVAADAIHSGWPLHSNVFDVSIPEELFDPHTGRTFLTGRRVPIHLPSEQQWGADAEHIGAITLAGGLNLRRLFLMLWGVLKREVQ